MTLRPPAFAVHKRQDGSAGTEKLDHAVSCSLAKAEFGRESRNISGRGAARVAP